MNLSVNALDMTPARPQTYDDEKTSNDCGTSQVQTLANKACQFISRIDLEDSPSFLGPTKRYTLQSSISLERSKGSKTIFETMRKKLVVPYTPAAFLGDIDVERRKQQIRDLYQQASLDCKNNGKCNPLHKVASMVPEGTRKELGFYHNPGEKPTHYFHATDLPHLKSILEDKQITTMQGRRSRLRYEEPLAFVSAGKPWMYEASIIVFKETLLFANSDRDISKINALGMKDYLEIGLRTSVPVNSETVKCIGVRMWHLDEKEKQEVQEKYAKMAGWDVPIVCLSEIEKFKNEPTLPSHISPSEIAHSSQPERDDE